MILKPLSLLKVGFFKNRYDLVLQIYKGMALTSIQVFIVNVYSENRLGG